MARIRTIKPEFFRHRKLFLLEQETGLPLRVAFSGLWTVADRNGRFEWEPDEIKLDCLPYDDVDFSRVLDALATRGFIEKYTVNGRDYGYIPGFTEHQVINNRESFSKIPPPPQHIENKEEVTRQPRVNDASATREARDTDLHKGKGKEGKGREEEGKGNARAPENEIFLKKIEEGILTFYEIGEVTNPQMFFRIRKFVEHMKPDDAAHFAEQFEAYREYLTHSRDKPILVHNFIGTEQAGFQDGKWMQANWKAELTRIQSTKQNGTSKNQPVNQHSGGKKSFV